MTSINVPTPVSIGEKLLYEDTHHTLFSIEINSSGVYYNLVDFNGNKKQMKLNFLFTPVKTNKKESFHDKKNKVINLADYFGGVTNGN